MNTPYQKALTGPACNVWKAFEAIAKIPRPSGNEVSIGNFLIDFADQRNISYQKDTIGNIIFHIEAHPEAKHCPRLILQSHMDMVCIGGNDRVATLCTWENDTIHSENYETTLGADNGIGMALMLGIIEEDRVHGPMSFLFTVDEEEGLTGAAHLDPNMIPADTKFLLNLDSEDGFQHFCTGSAGGLTAKGFKQYTSISQMGYKVSMHLQGLPGGHSGVNIHEFRPNALLVLMEALEPLWQKISLIDLLGGEKHNVIPSSASASFLVTNEEVIDALYTSIDILKTTYDMELKWDLEIDDQMKETVVLDRMSQDNFYDLFHTLPHGVLRHFANNPNIVISSNNIAQVALQENNLKVLLMYRSSLEEDLGAFGGWFSDEFARHFELVVETNQYTPWLEREPSLLQIIAQKITEDFGLEASFHPVHAGLEVADILKKCPEGTAGLSTGPHMWEVHTRHETVSISSTETCFQALCALIQNLAQATKPE